MKKKLLAVLLAATMVTGLAACGSKDSQTAADSGTAAADTAAADSSAATDDSAGTTADSSDPWANVDTSEHVKITYMTTGDRPSGTEAKFEEMMTEDSSRKAPFFELGQASSQSEPVPTKSTVPSI